MTASIATMILSSLYTLVARMKWEFWQKNNYQHTSAQKNTPVWVLTKIFSYSTLPDNQFWTIFMFQNSLLITTRQSTLQNWHFQDLHRHPFIRLSLLHVFKVTFLTPGGWRDPSKRKQHFWNFILQQGTDIHRTHRAPKAAKQDAN